MNQTDEFESTSTRREKPNTPHQTTYLGPDPYHGIAIQCQFCSGKSFRRSSLRQDDFTQILMMRYPVRCLRCGQRQLVSYTVASLSYPSSFKPRRRHRPVDPAKRWIDFTRHPDAPNPLRSAETEENSHTTQ